jgi:hypothetical protein
MPLEDRAADTWEPLIAVADLAGADWPTRAREAALTLTADHDANTDEPLSVRLLTDCRLAFGTAEALPTEELLGRLKEDPEAPWANWGGRAEGLTAMKLGVMLRQYDIRSGKIRLAEVGQVRGYRREDFTDAWRRYCPPRAEDSNLGAHDVDVDTFPLTLGERHWGSGPASAAAVDEVAGQKPPQPSQPSQPRSEPRRLDERGGLSRLTPETQDGSSRLTDKAASGLTSSETAWAAEAACPPETVVCITCRQPMTYDDGSHRHPLCSPA